MADSWPQTPGDSPRRWQYSIKFLLIVTTGVCIWAKIAVVVDSLCGGPYWFRGAFAVWLGALLAQGAICLWAWREINRRDKSISDESVSDDSARAKLDSRFRRSLIWGIVPLSQWLLVFAIAATQTPFSPEFMAFVAVTILHMSLPAALLLIGSVMRGSDVYPVRVMRWSVIVSCLIPVFGVVLALILEKNW